MIITNSRYALVGYFDDDNGDSDDDDDDGGDDDGMMIIIMIYIGQVIWYMITCALQWFKTKEYNDVKWTKKTYNKKPDK